MFVVGIGAVEETRFELLGKTKPTPDAGVFFVFALRASLDGDRPFIEFAARRPIRKDPRRFILDIQGFALFFQDGNELFVGVVEILLAAPAFDHLQLYSQEPARRG